MAIAIRVGHRRVGKLGQNVRVGEKAADEEAGQSDEVRIRAELEQLPVNGLQPHPQPQRIIRKDEGQQRLLQAHVLGDIPILK